MSGIPVSEKNTAVLKVTVLYAVGLLAHPFAVENYDNISSVLISGFCHQCHHF